MSMLTQCQYLEHGKKSIVVVIRAAQGNLQEVRLEGHPAEGLQEFREGEGRHPVRGTALRAKGRVALAMGLA